MDACYYSLVRRGEDGRFFGWVPDLPGVTAAGLVEKDVIRELSRNARQHVRALVERQQPVPAASPDSMPCAREQSQRYRRILLILS